MRTQVVEESMHVVFYEHDNTLEKRRIADLEEKLERRKANQHTQNIYLPQKASRKLKKNLLRHLRKAKLKTDSRN